MIRKDDILKMTEKGISVFRYYLPVDFKVEKNFLNPFYKDTKASCNIYYERKAGVFKMKDFGNEDYSGDCFELVGRLNGLSRKELKEFVEIMEMINRDLHLGLSAHEEYHVSHSKVPQKSEVVSEEPKAKSVRPYTVVQKNFTAVELAFLGKSGIGGNVLKAYRTVSLKKFSSENQERKPFSCMTSVDEPMFGYMGKQHIKGYRSCSQMRFLYAGDFGDNYCFRLEQLSAKDDLLFITGGEKDVMSLAAHGFHAICFNSETAFIPAAAIHQLSFRFKHILLLYDVDSTGLKSSAKREEELKEYGVKRLLLLLAGTKTEKDVSDYFMLGNSREDLIKLFLDYLETLYSETMSALKSCEVDFNNPPPIAQMIVSVNDVPLGTQGNLLCITGGEGTGKSNYVAALIAGAIRPTGTDVDALGVTLHENSRNKAVLFYDTEQSEVQQYKNISNLLRRCGREAMPEWFKAYCLTGMSRKERLLSIIQSLDKYHYQYGGVHLVVIDGIADLIKCANDEAESIAVVEELYRLAGIYKTCIVTVLHFIPNGLKLRGHLGSELQRKAVAILSIEKDSDPVVSVVKALKVRDGSPLDVPIMQFSWDKEKTMHVYLGEKPKEEKDKRKEGELVAVADSRSSKRFRDSAEKAMPSLVAETFIWKYFWGTNCLFFRYREQIIANVGVCTRPKENTPCPVARLSA